jgi:dTDP-glucose pyrophosphorylase
MAKTATDGRLDHVIIPPELPIAKAIERLDRAGTGALLICGPDRRLLGLLTDGDIRRAFLRGTPFDQPAATISTLDPLLAATGTTRAEMLRMMIRFDVNHLPVIDSQHRVQDFVLRSDFTREENACPAAVIMAGGLGERLRPLTEKVPKPLLPIGDRPIMEIIIGRLRTAGIRQVTVTTHYLGEDIVRYFGEGDRFGVHVNYLAEESPMGTVGGLAGLKDTQEPLLVINGDVLTGVDFQNLVEYHREHRADLTVGLRQFEYQVPYGVIQSDGPYVREINEKPLQKWLVNAGIYMLEPSVFRFIPQGQRFDMPDLIGRLLRAGRPVVGFPIVEYWLDIGRHCDYQQAQEDAMNGKVHI